MLLIPLSMLTNQVVRTQSQIHECIVISQRQMHRPADMLLTEPKVCQRQVRRHVVNRTKSLYVTQFTASRAKNMNIYLVEVLIVHAPRLPYFLYLF